MPFEPDQIKKEHILAAVNKIGKRKKASCFAWLEFGNRELLNSTLYFYDNLDLELLFITFMLIK